MVAKESRDVRLVGTAIIGGDFTGNARGANSIDIQTVRAAAEVASGARAVAMGYKNTASGDHAVAIGRGCTASSYYDIAIGRNCTAGGYYGNIAIGNTAVSTAGYGVAIGSSADASGSSSVSIGRNSESSDKGCIGIGDTAIASGQESTSIGKKTTATALRCMALGYNADATAQEATALGFNAAARVDKTTNIKGPIIIRKDDSELASKAFESYSGTQVMLVTKEVNLETVADQTLTLPSNCKFWLDEIGIFATSIVSLSTQPTIRFGITGTLAKHLAAVITTGLTATAKRETFTPLVPADGETTLTAGVTIVAVGTTVLGRFYWKGVLIEDE